MDTIKAFVDGQRANEHSFLFAIVLNHNNQHIGNIKIGPINKYHGHADISYFIGESSYWNRGIATEAIWLICKFGFTLLNLNKIEAGVYETAAASWKALEKNGFSREGVFREQVFCDGKYIDSYRYGLLRSEWIRNGFSAS